MLINNRILAKVSGSIQDWSKDLNNIYAGSRTVGALAFAGPGTDKLYIGGDLPFNHRYLEVGTVNAVASVASVELWNGKEWKAALDETDYSDLSGASLAQSAILQWNPDPRETWNRAKTEDISDLSTGPAIFDMYWARISFTANLTAGTTLKYVGHRFASEDQMSGRYPELVKSASRAQFAAGKTSWNDQLIEASEVVIRDLRQKRLILGPGQILGWEIFSEACVHKAAELIYTAFFSTQSDKWMSARKLYDEAMQAVSIGQGIDQDNDARVGESERFGTVGLVRR